MTGEGTWYEHRPGRYSVRCLYHPDRSLWAMPKIPCPSCSELRHARRAHRKLLRLWGRRAELRWRELQQTNPDVTKEGR